jgi:hypothetical protein
MEKKLRESGMAMTLMENCKLFIQMEIFIMANLKNAKNMAKAICFLVMGQNIQGNLKKEKFLVMGHILISRMINLRAFGMMEY